MNEAQFKERTKQAGLRIIRLVDALPSRKTADVLGRQLLRSGTAIGANYRAACRAVSTADLISKLGDVEEETDESVYWIELIVGSGLMAQRRVGPLVAELNEILAMAVASIKTLRRRHAAAKKRSNR
jgi:four helix bundle protein